MKRIKRLFLIVFALLFTMFSVIPVNASFALETKSEFCNNLNEDNTFSIILGFSGLNLMAIEQNISYNSEMFEFVSATKVTDSEFTLSRSEPYDEDTYKTFRLVADTDTVYQNANYVILTFKVTDAFEVGDNGRIFFYNYVAADGNKSRYRNNGFYYVITRDSKRVLSASKNDIDSSTKIRIWIEDRILFIAGGIGGFILLIIIISILPKGRRENRERKVIKNNKKIKKDNKSDFYDKEAGVPEFKGNKIKDKIDTVPFSPFNSSPNNFSGTSNSGDLPYNPIPNNYQASNNYQATNNYQSQNNYQVPNNNIGQNDMYNNSQQFNAFSDVPNNKNNNQQSNNNFSYDPRDNNKSTFKINESINNYKHEDEHKVKFFDDSEDKKIIEPAKKETNFFDDSSFDMKDNSQNNDNDDLETFDMPKKNDNDDMDMLVIALVLLVPLSIMFSGVVKAVEGGEETKEEVQYKVDDLRKCLVQSDRDNSSLCTSELDYSNDSQYDVLDLVYTKDLSTIQDFMLSDNDIMHLDSPSAECPTVTTTEAVSEETTSSVGDTTTVTTSVNEVTKKDGETTTSGTQYKVDLVKSNTNDDLTASVYVNSGESATFQIYPRDGYENNFALSCDDKNISATYKDNVVTVHDVNKSTKCTIAFNPNDVEVNFKIRYYVKNEETNKVDEKETAKIGGSYKYGSSVNLNLTKVVGYQYSNAAVCENSKDSTLFSSGNISVTDNKLNISSLTPYNNKNITCYLDYEPIEYKLKLESSIIPFDPFTVYYNNTTKISFSINKKYTVSYLDCDNDTKIDLPDGVILANNQVKYEFYYTHKTEGNVVCTIIFN